MRKKAQSAITFFKKAFVSWSYVERWQGQFNMSLVLKSKICSTKRNYLFCKEIVYKSHIYWRVALFEGGVQ